jgi:hypothetical protein
VGVRRVPEDLRALAADRRRIILVRIHDVGEPAPEESWLKQNARLVESRAIQSGTIQYFVPADSDVLPAARRRIRRGAVTALRDRGRASNMR